MFIWPFIFRLLYWEILIWTLRWIIKFLLNHHISSLKLALGGGNPVALKNMCACMYVFCVRPRRRPVVGADVNFLVTWFHIKIIEIPCYLNSYSFEFLDRILNFQKFRGGNINRVVKTNLLNSVLKSYGFFLLQFHNTTRFSVIFVSDNCRWLHLFVSFVSDNWQWLHLFASFVSDNCRSLHLFARIDCVFCVSW